MKIRKILLTGDDGYNSIGTRLLVHYLKNHYDLFIAGTEIQQSGVGGFSNITKDVHWQEIEVEGVKGICVNGSPSDAVEVANAFFKTKFDLVISGINLGVNVGGSYFTSGTIAAVLRAILLNVTSRGIALSYHVSDPRHWYHNHNGKDDITNYLDYPGKTTFQLINHCIDEDLWNCSFLNINLPTKKSNKVTFTRPLTDLGKFYTYPVTIDKNRQIYRYPMGIRSTKHLGYFDAGAIQKGYISITPCKADLLKEDVYEKLKNKSILLENLSSI